ncbi:MAG: hypothetical protein RMJ17_03055 [Candidatus Aenigmarchaeota archaeon]|nr:hypothetical protein [Candidatus Aenigmarchaeota archaeon]MDW8149545.1 hypothetical protein [Candidatus Aenigmarchaeota archaeon]
MKKSVGLNIVIFFLFLIKPTLASDYIFVKEELGIDFTTYNISWKIEIDEVGYYYPYKSEWGLPLPPNTDLKSIKAVDNLGNVEFKIKDDFIYLYTNERIDYGEVYYFNISFKQEGNPVSYDNEFYFKSYYTLKINADKIIIKLPPQTKSYKIVNEYELNVKTLADSPYTFEITSNKTISPKIIFWLEEFEEPKITQDYEHFTTYLPVKYGRKFNPIFSNISNIWSNLENFFNFKISKINITFVPVSNMKGDDLCFYYNNSITCGVHLFLEEEKYITQTLIHEITHAFISNIFGRGFSPWFEEGLSETLGFSFSETIGYNFTDTYNYNQKLINVCKNSLYENLWDTWECERFERFFLCFPLVPKNDECFNTYTASEIRYTFSWHIVNNEILKKIGKDKITYLSNYFQKNGVKVDVDSENKNSVVVLILFMASEKDFTEILNDVYKIKINTTWKNSYQNFKNAENEIQNLIKLSDFDYYKKAKSILNDSLSFLLNGQFDKSIEKSLESVEVAKEIRKEANETKQQILYANQTIIELKKTTSFPCIYDYPESLLIEAYENYKNGEFENSKKIIIMVLNKTNEINTSFFNFLEKFESLTTIINKTIFIYQPFISESKMKVENSWHLLSNCRLEDAFKLLSQAEIEMRNSMIIGNIIYFSVFMILIVVAIYFTRKRFKLKLG